MASRIIILLGDSKVSGRTQSKVHLPLSDIWPAMSLPIPTEQSELQLIVTIGGTRGVPVVLRRPGP